jgi:hypothetical protein
VVLVVHLVVQDQAEQVEVVEVVVRRVHQALVVVVEQVVLVVPVYL